MNDLHKTKIPVTCIDCGTVYDCIYSTYNSIKRTNPDYPQFRCPDCAKKFRAQKMKERMSSMSPEEKAAMYKKAGDNHSKTLAKMTKEEKDARMARVNAGRDEWLKNETDEERQRISEAHTKSNLRRWKKMNDEERERFIKKTRDAWHAKVDKVAFSKAIKERWKNKSPEERYAHICKIIGNSKKDDGLGRKFERTFKASHLINDFYYIKDYPLKNDSVEHYWDYAIFDSNNKLVIVVDLDGARYHADNCDYNAFSSKEQYDEKRWISIPEGVKSWIITEHKFSECFTGLVKVIMMNYDEYIESIFKEMRNQPFPEPFYTDIELLDSWTSIKSVDITRLKVTLSLNTRVGDRLIQHFHPSIWHDHRKGELSPYQAWQDDKLLRKCIENRIIYQTHLNPNKILQGFNVSKIAPKVSVFSAGRASIIIQKYLSEFDTIFDPFSGYSGRMLGALSLGKRYIGQDISLAHTNESNKMLEFLRKYCGVGEDSSVECKDIYQSGGDYPCLFTCPPYADKEQWQDVPVSTNTCDDWIDECLKRFKCRRYVFVVDNTEKYKDNIVGEINNQSHFGLKHEYVIVINK